MINYLMRVENMCSCNSLRYMLLSPKISALQERQEMFLWLSKYAIQTTIYSIYMHTFATTLIDVN